MPLLARNAVRSRGPLRDQPVIEFECLGCGTTFDVSETLAGKVIKCRECHQPGKVRAPLNGGPKNASNDGGPKSKSGDKGSLRSATASLASSLKGDYQCPYCGTRVPWEWRRIWTPASTLLLLAGGFGNVYTCWWSYQWAYQKALATSVTELDATISSGRLIWVFVLLCVAVTVDVMAFRLLWDWRQVCPRCGIRSG
jgi:DNA-directed RNA polymerase subunit RPC12/RpoP